jgi:hypothetical protein
VVLRAASVGRLLARPGVACRDAVASRAGPRRSPRAAMAEWFGGLAKTSRKSRQSLKTKGLTFILAMPPGCVAIATPGAAGADEAKRSFLKQRARHGLRSMIFPRGLRSKIFPRGPMRFGATKKGGVNAAGLIAFSKRSIAGGKPEIFSIVDRGPARIATKTKAFGDSPKQKSRLFYLPPYPSDRNPDELAWKHLKAATVGGMVIAGRTGFQNKVWASMRQPQNDAGEIISFFQKPPLEYAA